MYESMKVVQAVRDIVKESPDTVYEGKYGCCMYTEGKGGNGCGCLIGQAIVMVYPELQRKLYDVDRINTIPSAAGLFERYLTFEEKVGVEWLDCVQSQQDNGKTWEHAVDYADRNCPLS